ncbi:SusC/RagA family TonB-linked outer membrane protein [Sphingobacterium corticibacter]|uniref:SusC/RagA family TonB-linked outer membrane protein n=1 Tax=Sphingobacterium corticibacter TaxID=2171749 RepID=A0A2T8HLD6_9SPHI|nr:SusC/RagA family TonB-linked outer membrane protein [Sphingobacterium corticibacter]PVH26203.1 SusC/RagA family TonB-linked outer membrane protein [Sphingobacterium corticibacter]
MTPKLPFQGIHLLLSALVLFLLHGNTAFAQNANLNGKVTSDGQPISGATLTLLELQRITSTDGNGSFSFSGIAAGSYTLTVSFLGFETYRETIRISADMSPLNINLHASSREDIGEVNVVGYASVRRKDLTGAVTRVSEKDFNQGPFTAPDQLIQGKAPGVQMINNSGQPGGETTVRIRGNSAVTGSGQPLYVIDGIALDGRSPRPQRSAAVGSSPGGNPLVFLNPSDIESMEILKDASATAIYGARAAYGVVLITTKRGKAGDLRVDVNASTGIASLMRRIDILDANQFRNALSSYELIGGDLGNNVDAIGAITRNAIIQNYAVSMSGGTDDAKFRASIGYQDQEGILLKSGFKKVAASVNGNFRMLESKKLGLDLGLIGTQTNEQLAAVTTDAGFMGSLVGQALNWNPTEPLYNNDGSLNIKYGTSIINPLGMAESNNDLARVSTVIGSVSPYYKFNDWLEYRVLGAVNYSTGIRRASTRSWINIPGIVADPNGGALGGEASYANNELTTQQLTHTLTFNREIANKLNLNAIIGYEYMNFMYKGMDFRGINYGDIDIDYTDALQAGSSGNRIVNSFNDPTTELQSYFLRAILNYDSRYLLTATMRRDGSTKFGDNNRYGNFPSFSAAWNIRNESFMQDVAWLNELRLRAGWGRTGNQEFPAGSAINRYGFINDNAVRPINNGNPNLRWQSDEQINIGFDFGIFGNKLSGSIDAFDKKTTDLLYPTIPLYPNAPDAPIIWSNLDGRIRNRGIEFALHANIMQKEHLTWNMGANLTLLKNEVSNMNNVILTGALSGQGVSGATVQVIQSGLPMFAMMTREYLGLDPDGFSNYTDDGFSMLYVGNPNPTALIGFSTDVAYKKFTFSANFNGALGQDIYNNTANTVLPITNLGGFRNITADLLKSPIQESLTNSAAPSSRFIENGSYIKLANATIAYQVGNIGASMKNLNIFFNGTNLLLFTKYSGFDPEVNTPKGLGNTGSAGIDYIGYPPARTFNLGVNFTL